MHRPFLLLLHHSAHSTVNPIVSRNAYARIFLSQQIPTASALSTNNNIIGKSLSTSWENGRMSPFSLSTTSRWETFRTFWRQQAHPKLRSRTGFLVILQGAGLCGTRDSSSSCLGGAGLTDSFSTPAAGHPLICGRVRCGRAQRSGPKSKRLEESLKRFPILPTRTG
jgi:hypothetical protein